MIRGKALGCGVTLLTAASLLLGAIGVHGMDFKNKSTEIGYWLAKRDSSQCAYRSVGFRRDVRRLCPRAMECLV